MVNAVTEPGHVIPWRKDNMLNIFFVIPFDTLMLSVSPFMLLMGQDKECSVA
jgi:hypothetical protein